MTPPRVRPLSPRWAARGGVAVVLFAVAACYFIAVRGEFVWDDHTLIVDNPTLRSARYIPQILTTNLWAFIGRTTNYYRPVPPLFLMLVYALFGPNPAAFHAASLVLHAVSAALVYGIARVALRSSASGQDPAWPALAAALVFGLHPVNTESVAWNAGLVDVVGTFFCILAVWSWVMDDASRSSRRWRALSYAALALALFSKEPALAIAPALAVYDLACRPGRVPDVRAALRRWGPILAVCAAYLATRVLVLGGLSPARHGPPGRLADGPILLSRYVEKLVLPVHLSAVPDVPGFEAASAADLLRAAAVIAAFVAAAALAWRRARTLLFAFSLVVLPLAPPLYAQVLNRPELLANRFAERHLYLSTVGWALVAAGAGWSLARSAALRRAVVSAAVLVVIAFGAGTLLRIPVWRDDLALWSDAAEKSPGVSQVHFLLASARLVRGDEAGAAQAAQEGARLDPEYLRGLLAAGLDAARTGDHRLAITRLKLLTLAAPDLSQARFELAEALSAAGQTDAAFGEYVEVLQRDPRHAAAAARVAFMLRSRGRLHDAIRVLELAIRRSPDDPSLQRDLEQARELEARSVAGHR